MKVPNKDTMKPLGQGVYTDGTLAFKFYDSYHERHPEIEVEALRRVQGIEGTQRFVDYDEKEKILVTELVRGHLLDENSDEFQTGNLHYTNEQLEGLFRTLTAMQDKGVIFEAHAKNLFYDSSQGFTPIDYNIPKEAHIDLGALIDILSIRGVPVERENGYAIPMNGLNRQNHPDIRGMVYEAFTNVNPQVAAKEISRFEENEKAFTALSNKLDENVLSYEISTYRI